MKTYKCVKRYKDRQGRITGYKIEDNLGNQMDVGPNDLKSVLGNNAAIILNLKLTSDGRIIKNSIPMEESIHCESDKIVSIGESRVKIQGRDILDILIRAYKNSGCDYLIWELTAKEVRGQVWRGVLSLIVDSNKAYDYEVLEDKNNKTYTIYGKNKEYVLDSRDEAIGFIAEALMALPRTVYKSSDVNSLLYRSDDNRKYNNLKLVLLGKNVICTGASDRVTSVRIPRYVNVVTNLAFIGCDRLHMVECTKDIYDSVKCAIDQAKLRCGIAVY